MSYADTLGMRVLEATPGLTRVTLTVTDAGLNMHGTAHGGLLFSLADEAFARFVATQETDPTHSRELRTVFVAFLLEPQCRMLLEDGRFAELRARDPNLYGSLQQLTPEEREELVFYLRANVVLGSFVEAAARGES